MMNVTDRFLKYVGYGTQSDPNTGLNPSTPGQMEFAHVLKEEMEAIGIQEVELDEFGYVMGVIPSTVERETPAIGFIAHMDTSPEMSGRHVNPRIIENYAGNDIVLNKEKGIVLSTEEFPELMNYVGQTLITTDGNTLLGADDKAGIAEILTAAEYLIGHPEVKHGKICICFTPDEEIGEGPDHFNVKKFGAKFAYTMDGGEIGELEFENFNAANARIVFKGRNIHPGYAKNKMVNSIALANEFMASLPKKEVPENTSGYEGFFHVYSIKGDVETTEIEILIRDFDRERFEWRKNTIENGRGKLGRVFFRLSHEHADLLRQGVALGAQVRRLIDGGAVGLVELDHLVDERQLRVLKLFADVLPNELGVFTDESNVNHVVSVSSMF